MSRALATLCLLLVATGCGLLGDETPPLRRIRQGGTGPFRDLEPTDTSLSSPPDGRMTTNYGSGGPGWGYESIGRLAWNDAGCYASRATLVMPVLPRDPGAPVGEPDPSQLADMGIARCDDGPGIVTTVGETVLTAEEPWEGADLEDPWAIRLPDGSIRLYYVAQGSIGVADAEDQDGPFVRVSDAPVLGPLEGVRPLHSPSVVVAPDGSYVMYFDDGADIYVAQSEDGIAFDLVDTDPSTPTLDPLALEPRQPEETTRLHPGAIVDTTYSGRQVVRIYFDVDIGTRSNVCMAGSFDGITFERHPQIAYRAQTISHPVPRILETGETLLTVTRVVSRFDALTRVPTGAVAPTFATFGEPAEAP